MPRKRCVVPRRPHRPCALACVRPTPEFLPVSRRRQEPFTRLYSQTVTVTACGGQTVRLDTDTSPGKWRELCGLSVCPKHVCPAWRVVLDKPATFGAPTAMAGLAVDCSSRGGPAAALWANSVEVIAAPAISAAARREVLRMGI